MLLFLSDSFSVNGVVQLFNYNIKQNVHSPVYYLRVGDIPDE